MALPGGRPIVVDGKQYEWIVKKDKRASRYDEDDYGDEMPIYDKVVTIRAIDSGKLIQQRIDRSAVTPEFVSILIQEAVLTSKL